MISLLLLFLNVLFSMMVGKGNSFELIFLNHILSLIHLVLVFFPYLISLRAKLLMRTLIFQLKNIFVPVVCYKTSSNFKKILKLYHLSRENNIFTAWVYSNCMIINTVWYPLFLNIQNFWIIKHFLQKCSLDVFSFL